MLVSRAEWTRQRWRKMVADVWTARILGRFYDVYRRAPVAVVYAHFAANFDATARVWLRLGLRLDINVNISTTEMGMSIAMRAPRVLMEEIASYIPDGGVQTLDVRFVYISELELYRRLSTEYAPGQSYLAGGLAIDHMYCSMMHYARFSLLATIGRVWTNGRRDMEIMMQKRSMVGMDGYEWRPPTSDAMIKIPGGVEPADFVRRRWGSARSGMVQRGRGKAREREWPDQAWGHERRRPGRNGNNYRPYTRRGRGWSDHRTIPRGNSKAASVAASARQAADSDSYRGKSQRCRGLVGRR